MLCLSDPLNAVHKFGVISEKREDSEKRDYAENELLILP